MTQETQDETCDARLVIRSRERRETWGTSQVLECRRCGRRWSE